MRSFVHPGRGWAQGQGQQPDSRVQEILLAGFLPSKVWEVLLISESVTVDEIHS
jgi:hypothetical protein